MKTRKIEYPRFIILRNESSNCRLDLMKIVDSSIRVESTYMNRFE